ncbi:MAG: alpha/beta hydrolase [Acidimicrobiales bacterium]
MADLPDLGVPFRYDPATDADGTGGITFLALHGAASTEDDLVDVARRISPGVAVLSPRGPLTDEDGGFRHLPVRPPPEEEAELDPDLPTPWAVAVHEGVAELAAFLAAACKALDLDSEDIWVLGFSDGATAAAALALDHPDAIAGAVILSGKPSFRPPGGRVLDHKQIFCATGRNDERVTIDDYEELVEGLVTAGADVELHWYDVGHEIPDKALEDAATWLGKRLAVS